MLSAASLIKSCKISIVGVNTGRLGFLANVAKKTSIFRTFWTILEHFGALGAHFGVQNNDFLTPWDHFGAFWDQVGQRISFSKLVSPNWEHFGSILQPIWSPFGTQVGPEMAPWGDIFGHRGAKGLPSKCPRPPLNGPGADLGAIWRGKRSKVAFSSVLVPFLVDFGRILDPLGRNCL